MKTTDATATLLELLRQVQETADCHPDAPTNMASLLLFEWNGENDGANSDQSLWRQLAVDYYQACRALKLPLRRLTDLWSELSALVAATSGGSQKIYSRLHRQVLDQFWWETLDEDDLLTPHERELIKEQTVDAFVIRRTLPAAPTSVHVFDRRYDALVSQCEITTATTRAAVPEIGLRGGADAIEIILRQELTRRAFLVWADLSAMYDARVLRPFRPGLDSAHRIVTRWQSNTSPETYEIRWPAPPFRTFRDAARFDFAFANRLQQLRTVSANSDDEEQDLSYDARQIKRTACQWIAAGADLLLAATSEDAQAGSATNEDALGPWEFGKGIAHAKDLNLCLNRLAERCEDTQRSPHERQWILEWLTRVALLLTPELNPDASAGGDGDALNLAQFFSADTLLNVWRKVNPTIRAWRALRLAEFDVRGMIRLRDVLRTRRNVATGMGNRGVLSKEVIASYRDEAARYFNRDTQMPDEVDEETSFAASRSSLAKAPRSRRSPQSTSQKRTKK